MGKHVEHGSEVILLSPLAGVGGEIELMIGITSYTFIDPDAFLQVASLHQPAAVFLHRDFIGWGKGLSFLATVLSTYPETPTLIIYDRKQGVDFA
jgi:hypothetical protein